MLYYYHIGYQDEDWGESGHYTLCHPQQFSKQDWHNLVHQTWVQMAGQARSGQEAARDVARYICSLPLGFTAVEPTLGVQIMGRPNPGLSFPSAREYIASDDRDICIEP